MDLQGSIEPEKILTIMITNHVKMAFSNPNYYRAVLALSMDKEYQPGFYQSKVISGVGQLLNLYFVDLKKEQEDIEFITAIVMDSLRGFTLKLINSDGKMDQTKIKKHLKIFTKFIYLSVIGTLVLLMWLGRIIPALISGTAPFGIDHYSTLPIQVMDLSIIIPLSFITSILLWQKKPWGYVLSGIVIFKALTLLLAIFAMIIAEYIHGNPMNSVEVIIFLAIIFVNLGFTALVFRAVPSE